MNKTAPVVDVQTPYKMIRTTNVRDGWVDLSSVRCVDAATYEKWTRRQKPKCGDVILTREAPLGEIGMLRSSEKVFLGQRLVAYRADPNKLDNRFLLYAMLGDDMQGQIQSMGSGATVEHMRVPDCEKLTLRLPPLATQRRIAAILSAYDDLIENNTRRIAILEEMARRIYEEWFVRFHFPGHEHTRMVESPLGLVPEGWEPCEFTAIADVLSGGTPKKSEAKFWDGDIAFFTPTDAPGSAYVLDTQARITAAGLAHCASKLYPKNTLFITARGTVGKLALASTGMAMNQSCYALNAKGGYGQLFLYLATQNVVAELRAMSHGAVFDTIIMDTFRRMRIVKPSVDMAVQFEEVVRPVFALSLALSRKNTNLRTTRDLLLPRLISGELDVSDLPEPQAVAA
ncbi:MAG: restriction endonuclease subunit S [Metallibacterium sp.]